MSIPLDIYDQRILALLQEESSLSTAEIAERIGLSQSLCWRRIQRLKEEGVIRKQVTLLDRKKIGLNTQVFAQIKLNAHGRKNLTDFAEAMHQFPEVLECHVLMGAVDFMLRIVTRDIESYERFFFEKLSAVPGIQEVNSIVALSEIKSTTTLPLLAPEPSRRTPAHDHQQDQVQLLPPPLRRLPDRQRHRQRAGDHGRHRHAPAYRTGHHRRAGGTGHRLRVRAAGGCAQPPGRLCHPRLGAVRREWVVEQHRRIAAALEYPAE